MDQIGYDRSRKAAGAARKIWNIAAERNILPPPAVTQ